MLSPSEIGKKRTGENKAGPDRPGCANERVSRSRPAANSTGREALSGPEKGRQVAFPIAGVLNFAGREKREGPSVALWLFKEEPTHYSFQDLQRDGRATWDGVTNALALKHLRQVCPGDRALYYHTGKEKAVVGEMRVSAAVNEGEAGPVHVEVEPVRALARPVPLSLIKEDPALAAWDLVRLPRLSVMPVSEEQWRRVEELARAVE